MQLLSAKYLTSQYLGGCGDNTKLQLIHSIVSDFSLNEAQARAFTIIANHSTTPQIEPLRMYIGGMAGTGKSQVIKAVSEYFSRKREKHRFLLLAPTGTAASVINGSTYHSALGINGRTGGKGAGTALSTVQTRLRHVDYIFIDEVSMISCLDMYNICY